MRWLYWGLPRVLGVLLNVSISLAEIGHRIFLLLSVTNFIYNPENCLLSFSEGKFWWFLYAVSQKDPDNKAHILTIFII